MADKKTCVQCVYFVMRGLVPITEKNVKSEKALLKHMEKIMKSCPELCQGSAEKATKCYEPDVYPGTTQESIALLRKRIEKYEKENPRKRYLQCMKNFTWKR